MAGIRVFGAAALVALASGVPLAEAAKVQEGGNESALPPSRASWSSQRHRVRPPRSTVLR